MLLHEAGDFMDERAEAHAGQPAGLKFRGSARDFMAVPVLSCNGENKAPGTALIGATKALAFAEKAGE